LVPPIANRPLILYILTTTAALGALLAQHDESGKEHAIYYISRTLVGYELNYSPMGRTCLASVFTFQKLRHYMLNQHTNLIAKIDPLKYLLAKEALTSRLAKWVMTLSEFDIVYVDRKAIKGQALADQLAEAPMTDIHPMVSNFLDENLFTLSTSIMWKLYFDGSYT